MECTGTRSGGQQIFQGVAYIRPKKIIDCSISGVERTQRRNLGFTQVRTNYIETV